MTKADIPPGGEGQVKVSFSTKGKKGSQRKTITITSNDPDEPITRVYVEAFIEVAFGFESYGLNMGDISGREPVSKTTHLLIRDPDQTEIKEFNTSSEFITAKQLMTIRDSSGAKIEIEITVHPGISPGRLNETVTVHSNLKDYPQAAIRITGRVKGDIALEPEFIKFDRYPSDSSKTTWVQKFKIVNESKDRPLEVLSVNNPSGHLELDLETLEPGKLFEVTARLNEDAVAKGSYYSGTITIMTDNPKQESVEARYMIYNR